MPVALGQQGRRPDLLQVELRLTRRRVVKRDNNSGHAGVDPQHLRPAPTPRGQIAVAPDRLLKVDCLLRGGAFLDPFDLDDAHLKVPRPAH
jgi:hypothetical protein